ncbi:MAG: MFS transporter [Deferribacteraceae bacterium]|jgi:FSR family fosmidomycin resistance protein-like MFS transporter|nr:MFS transporter [Deferribacteraceae bacterium]
MIKQFIQSIPKPVWLISANHMSVDLSAGAFYIVLPYIKAKFGLNYLEITTIVLVNSISASILQPLLGYICDKKPRAWLMPAGCLLTASTLPLILFSPYYWMVCALTALNGLGSASFHPLGAKTANMVTAYNRKGRSLSIFSLGGSFGVMAGSVFISLLMEAGVGWHIWIYSLPSIVIAISMFRIIPSLPPYPPSRKREDGKSSLADVLKLSMLAFFGMLIARAIVMNGLSTFVPLYYISHLGGNQLTAGFLLSFFMGAAVIGTLLGGMLSDKYGSKRVMLVSILPVTPLIFIFERSSHAGIFITLALAGILLAATNTSSLALIQKLLPDNLGMASGINLGLSVGLSAIGVIALGNMADIKGLELVFTILAILPIFGFVMTLFIREPSANKQQ